MGADGVEVAEGGDLHSGIGDSLIDENLFDDVFCLGVGIRDVAAGWGFFGDGRSGGVAVDAGGGAEDEFFDAVVVHRVEEVEGDCDVVAIIFEGFLDGFADGFKAGEVEDGIELVVGKKLVERGGVFEVDLVEFWEVTGDFFNATKDAFFAVTEVVGDDGSETRLDKLYDGMRTDVASAAGD